MTNETHYTRPRGLWPSVIVLVTGVLAAYVAGHLDGHRARGGGGPSGLVGGGLVLLAGTVVMWLYLRRFGPFWRAWSPRQRVYGVGMILSGAMGLLGSIVVIGEGGLHGSSNGAMAPAAAIGLSLLWIVGMGVALILYHRTVDEHERQAYQLSALTAFNAFALACPVWWMLARADLAPPVEVMPLHFLTLIVNGIAYLWFRYR